MINMINKRKYNWMQDAVQSLTKGWILVAGCWLMDVGCGTAGKDGSKVFHYNEHSGIVSLDPAFAKSQATMWPAHQLFNTLVEVNDSLKIVPSLAKSWEVSAGRLTYIFHLRKTTKNS